MSEPMVFEFKARRQALLAKMQDNSLAVIPSAHLHMRNGDAEFPFRQNSDFFYLSGFVEESSVLVLVNKAGEHSSILFCQAKDKASEIWTGYRLGPDAAPAQLHVDQALDIAELADKLPEFMSDLDAVYSYWGQDTQWDQTLFTAIDKVKAKARTGVVAPNAMVSISPMLTEMRLIKDAAEIQTMRTAAQVSAQAHIEAMKMAKPGVFEYQLEGQIRHYCAMQGMRFDAYQSIEGSGDNACILHYSANDQQIADGDLILIDAGCEHNHYASDITRTFPANGKFSEPQKAIYQIVLDAQLAAIKQVKPGNAYEQIHQAALRVITQGLMDLGLLNGELDALIKDEAYKPFYMHGTGHWLGLDVHDVGVYKIDGQSRALQAGMVLTVEPGIYIAPDNDTVDKKWRGIGVRIEDDVLVTDEGHEILSKAVPKSIVEIEALMAG